MIAAILDIVLMFRQMNASGTGALSSDEFLNVYDVTTLKWDPQYSSIPWYHTAWKPLQMLCVGANAAIISPYFEPIVCKYSSIIDSKKKKTNINIYRWSNYR